MTTYVMRRLFAAIALFAFAAAISIGGIATASTPTSTDHDPHHGTATAGSCAVLADGTPMSGGMMSGGMMSGSPMAGMQMQQDFDLMFIDMMIPHHQGAVAIAEVALERGEHQEVLDLAQEIIDSQQAEIDQMTAWRDAWYPDAPAMPMDQMGSMMMGMMIQMPGMMGTPGTGMGHTGSFDDMMGMMDPESQDTALCDASGSFDEAFLRKMIPHHQSAVMMAQVALVQATHPEIKELAQAIIDSQQAEIAQMQGWLENWYGAGDAASPVSSSGAIQVDITLTEFAIESSLTTFQVDQAYKFVVTNDGAIAHELMVLPRMEGIGQMDMEALDAVALFMIEEDDLSAGSAHTIEVTFTEPAAAGSLDFVCAIPGHHDAGMTAPIVVQ